MTAPFAPPPPWPVVAVLIGMVVVALAMPFMMRDDWLGWVAFPLTAAVAVGLWGLLGWGLTRATLRWWRRRPGSE